MNMILQIAAAGIGTVAFALLFGVPSRFYACCGAIGAMGWAVYCALTELAQMETGNATFCATVLVLLASRFCAVWKKCPGTVFTVTGIFPLVPGAGIYRTISYLVMEDMHGAMESGFSAIRAVLAIVFGIVLVLELPNRLFHLHKNCPDGHKEC